VKIPEILIFCVIGYVRLDLFLVVERWDFVWRRSGGKRASRY